MSNDIAGYLPSLSFEGSFGINVSLSGGLPDLQIDASFGTEMFIAGELPAADGAVLGAGQVASSLPALSFSGEITQENWIAVTGNLPCISGDIEGAGNLNTGTLPALACSLTIETPNSFSVQGQLPQMRGSITGAVTGSISSLLPNLSIGELSGSGLVTGSIDSVLPTLQCAISQDPFTLIDVDCTLPPLEFTGKITPDPGVTISGTLPNLKVLSLIGNSTQAGITVTASTDDVIRFRRGYDNG